MSSITAASSSSLWLLPKPSPSKFSKFPPCPSFPPSSPSCYRVVCRSGSPQRASTDLSSALHDALDSSGIDTSHAREARKSFVLQIQKLSDIERETSISINRCVDLGRTALYIAEEDDSLISHSSVPLPVDAFLERLDDLSMGYCSHYNSSCRSSQENFLESIEKYLFVKKGFRRSSAKNQAEPRALYLHSVLTHRSGSAVMLSLIYSEILKMLRLWGLLDFDVEIFFPLDLHGLPTAYDKQKSKESDQPHIMTVQMLMEEYNEVKKLICETIANYLINSLLSLLQFFSPMFYEKLMVAFLRSQQHLSDIITGVILRNLKDAFWPFQHDHADSLFLRAAHAANCIDKYNGIQESGYQLASAKAAQHRLERGVWTSVHFGDMRRALAACERLILLQTEPKEMRDYSVLLYHCGLYEQALKYLELYQDTKSSSSESQPTNSVSNLEEDAVQKLIVRLNLIAMEEVSLVGALTPEAPSPCNQKPPLPPLPQPPTVPPQPPSPQPKPPQPPSPSPQPKPPQPPSPKPKPPQPPSPQPKLPQPPSPQPPLPQPKPPQPPSPQPPSPQPKPPQPPSPQPKPPQPPSHQPPSPQPKPPQPPSPQPPSPQPPSPQPPSPQPKPPQPPSPQPKPPQPPLPQPPSPQPKPPQPPSPQPPSSQPKPPQPPSPQPPSPQPKLPPPSPQPPLPQPKLPPQPPSTQPPSPQPKPPQPPSPQPPLPQPKPPQPPSPQPPTAPPQPPLPQPPPALPQPPLPQPPPALPQPPLPQPPPPPQPGCPPPPDCNSDCEHPPEPDWPPYEPWVPPLINQNWKCWQSLNSIGNCIEEIIISVRTGNIVVGSACCYAFKDISDDCFNRMFVPYNPVLPLAIREHCFSLP
ncbi:Prolamin-like domain - like 2 [Theobroma cacao]|nr:Prolamin-like domain - like 2 [Theobroma cacao]